MACSHCGALLEIFSKGTRLFGLVFFYGCPLDLRVIQAYHPQVTERCQQLLVTASVVHLQMLGRNFKSNFLLSVTQKGKWDVREACWRVPDQLFTGSGAVCRRKEVTLPCAVSLQSVSSHTCF